MTATATDLQSARMTTVRWTICALLFLAMVCNYIDRQMLGFLKPTLSKEFGWSETTYADFVFWFQAAYAVSYLLFGRIVDRVGAKLGYAGAFVIWTIGHIGHAAARSVASFTAARMILGVGEGGSFPAGLKAATEWFPKSERAFATGLFNAGTNIGAIITPLVVPPLVLGMGWRGAFVVTGIGTSIWLLLWLLLYRRPQEHPGVNAAELAHITADPADPTPNVPWRKVLAYRETWAYAAGKFLIDPIWWMFLFWLPDFFAKRHGLDLKSFGPPIVAVYVLSDIGSIAGGWASSALMKRGWTINAARKATMLACSILVLPIAFAMYADSLWLAVGIVGLATAAHQGFSANLYTLPSDVFPRSAVGSVVGIGGMAGAVGGMLMAKYAGWVLDQMHTYTPIFIVAAGAYLVALAAVHALTPKMTPVKID
ncbi:MAG: MFS transporter [Proteobacteria bacterium]|nr:MFS transporter [Pseudomonadota bacterium]